jgi:hypothetical protein
VLSLLRRFDLQGLGISGNLAGLVMERFGLKRELQQPRATDRLVTPISGAIASNAITEIDSVSNDK